MARGKKTAMEVNTQVDVALPKVQTPEQSLTIEPSAAPVEPALDPLASMRVTGDADVLSEDETTLVSGASSDQTEEANPMGVTGSDPGPTLAEEHGSVQVQSSAAIPPPLVHEMVVQNKVTISWGAQMITLHPGQRVSDSSYGDGALQRMMSAGVSLKFPDE